MTKLLPCPFCGGSATMEQTGDDRWSVGCDSADEPTCMGYQSFTTFARQGEASEAWNRRAAILPQRMPTREEMAGIVYEGAHKGLKNCWKWTDDGLDAEHPGRRGYYYKIADAVLAALSHIAP